MSRESCPSPAHKTVTWVFSPHSGARTWRFPARLFLGLPQFQVPFPSSCLCGVFYSCFFFFISHCVFRHCGAHPCEVLLVCLFGWEVLKIYLPVESGLDTGVSLYHNPHDANHGKVWNSMRLLGLLGCSLFLVMKILLFGEIVQRYPEADTYRNNIQMCSKSSLFVLHR